MRRANVFYKDQFAGVLTETEAGYEFTYDREYLSSDESCPISLTLPLREKSYMQKTMFAFFDGLIPEGWLLEIALTTWKINSRDRMGLLLSCCRDCVGAVSIIPLEGEI